MPVATSHQFLCVQLAIHVTWWNYWPHTTFVGYTVKAMRTSAVTYRLVWLTFLLDQLWKIAQKQTLSQLSASSNCYNQEKADQNLSGSRLHDWGMQTEGEVRDKSKSTRQNNHCVTYGLTKLLSYRAFLHPKWSGEQGTPWRICPTGLINFQGHCNVARSPLHGMNSTTAQGQ